MGKTSIEYADEVSNPLYARPIGNESVKVGTFCEKPDPEGTCKHCWAEALNKRFGNGFAFDKANRDKIEWLPRPKEIERLQRLNAKKPMSEKFPGNRLVVFSNDTYDIFQPSISDGQRDWVFDEFDRLENLTLLVQSTYVARMSAYLQKRYPHGMPRQYFIGMSCGTQKFLDDNFAHLVKIHVPRRYIIFEPLLERIELATWLFSAMTDDGKCAISLCIVGGESGTGARPMCPDWAREIRDQCLAVCKDCKALTAKYTVSTGPGFLDDSTHWIACQRPAFLFKQWGEHGLLPGTSNGTYRIGKKKAGRLLDGREWNEMPTVTKESCSTAGR